MTDLNIRKPVPKLYSNISDEQNIIKNKSPDLPVRMMEELKALRTA
jgi:hypothetical protein